MADMENVHRHEKEEEVAAEQPPPQPDFTDLSSFDEGKKETNHLFQISIYMR